VAELKIGDRVRIRREVEGNLLKIGNGCLQIMTSSYPKGLYVDTTSVEGDTETTVTVLHSGPCPTCHQEVPND
jgi:hypothetical protein